MSKHLIDFIGISKSYDSNLVLDDLNLYIRENEFLTLLGPSGCGKTTTLRLLGGFESPDKGQILFDGQEMTRLPMEKRGFNIVFQDYALFPNLNVYQNITYGLKNRPGISTKQEVEELIDLLGLREHLAKKIEQLSGGQKQRLCIARALLKKPKILILDDSTSAVDTKTDALIRQAFREEIPDTTRIIIAQRVSSVEDADVIIVMDKGEISGIGTSEELLKTNAIYREVYESQMKGGKDSE